MPRRSFAAVSLLASCLFFACIATACQNPSSGPMTAQGNAIPTINWESQQWDHKAINLAQAWSDAPKEGAGVRVCDIDTGVKADNPDISPSIIAGVNTNDVVNPNNWQDDVGHGTFTSGQIVASGKQLVGVAPKAKLLVAKVLDGTGKGDDIAGTAGIAWCVSEGANVINMSIGGQGDPKEGLQQAIAVACKHGVALAVSSGNNGQDGAYQPVLPAAIKSPCLIAVNAVDNHGQLAAFSDYHENVNTVSAPGKSVVGYWGDNIAFGSGTSFSAPLVSGTLALLMGQGATAQQAVQDVLQSADRPPAKAIKGLTKWNVTMLYGHGELDAAKAIRLFNKVRT